MNGWAGGFIALIGVVVGGSVAHISAILRAKQERRWEVVRHKRDKLEELSIVLDALENRYREFSGAAALMLEKSQPMQFAGSRIPTARLTTLIEFYAPELKAEKKELDTLTEEYGKLLAKVIKSSQLDGPSKLQLMEKVLLGHRGIEDKCRDLATKAAEIVQREVACESSNNTFNSDRLFRWRSKAGRLS